MLKERVPYVFVHLHRILEQRVGFFGLSSLKDAPRRDYENHPEHQFKCRRWHERKQESHCYRTDYRPYPHWRYRLSKVKLFINGFERA